MKPELPDSVELESRPCPNGCNAGDRFVIEGQDRLHHIPGRYRIVKCLGCGLMRTDPRPSPCTIGTYYPDDYGPYAAGVQASACTMPGWRRRMRAALGFEVRRLPPIQPGRLLEIGCASGAWLNMMREQGWQVEGIEFSDAAARHARAQGLAVQTASVETAKAPTVPLDLIAAWMVLEHLHEPLAALRRLRDWTRPDGWLIAAVPDSNALSRRLSGEHAYDLHLPNHLYHYTPRTLAVLLHAAGWQLEHVFWQRNANNLLWSIEYLARDRNWRYRLAAVIWLRTARRAGRLRMLIGWLLGVTRQSGRIEIWARPRPDVAGSNAAER